MKNVTGKVLYHLKINLSHIDERNKQAEVGIILARQYFKKGYAKAPIKLMLRPAFETLKVYWVHFSIIEENSNARGLYEEWVLWKRKEILKVFSMNAGIMIRYVLNSRLLSEAKDI